eukprot:9011827-Alexandrium_andersonii.AAC.1
MLSPATEAAGSSEGVRIQRARRLEPLMGDTLAEPHSPARWLAEMSAAGRGARQADMRTIRPLRQRIWEQTQEA